MGQKVNPIGLRVGINRTWDSRWFAGKDYAQLLHEDLKLKEYLRDRLAHYFVSSAASARSRTITVRLLHFFSTRTPRPLARAAKRFSLKLPPT